MSGGNRRQRRIATRHLCADCRKRRARFRYRGEVRADRHHILCFRCFRSERERLRAWKMREGLPGGWLEPTAAGAKFRHRPVVLTERRIEHRRRMLAHMERLAVSG